MPSVLPRILKWVDVSSSAEMNSVCFSTNAKFYKILMVVKWTVCCLSSLILVNHGRMQ